MNFVGPLLLSGTGVAVASVAFWNRDKPEVRQNMTFFMTVAVGHVLLGAVSFWLFH